MKIFRKYRQHDQRDCGAACLATIFSYYGLKMSLPKCREVVKTALNGTNIFNIVEGARQYGFEANAYKGTVEEVGEAIKKEEIILPLMAHIVSEEGMEHFVVILRMSRKKMQVFDPGVGTRWYDMQDFCKVWRGHVIELKCSADYEGRNELKGYWNIFIGILAKQKAYWCGIFIFSLLIICISLVGALAYEQVVDKIILHQELEEETHDHGMEGEAIQGLNFILEPVSAALENISDVLAVSEYLFLTLIGLYCIQSILQVIRGNLLAIVSKRINISLLELFEEKIHKLPLGFFDKLRSGELISRFSDIEQIRDGLSSVVLAVVFDLFSFLMGATAMFLINKVLFLLMLGVSVVYIVIILFYRPVLNKISHDIMGQNAKVFSEIKEEIQGIETIKLYNADEYFLNRTKKEMLRMAKYIYKGEKTYVMQNTLVYFLESFAIAIVLCIGSALVIDGNLTLGFLIVFETLIGYIMMPIKEIIDMQPTIQRAFVAADRLNDILLTEENIVEEGCMLRDGGYVRLREVGFYYHEQLPILKNISLLINQGEKIALTGKSGCGKTTLAKMLLKLNVPQMGQIFINDTDISEIQNRELWKNVIYISQETYWFPDTIRNNLVMGDESITEEDIRYACKISMIDSILEELPLGLDTILSENGNNLSGGQKQRLAIARALVRRPQILIMDEATSQVDSVTESKIHNALFEHYEGMTCIIIAHRLSALKKCDRIVLLDCGNICEEGDHNELMEKRGRYYNMWFSYVEED